MQSETTFEINERPVPAARPRVTKFATYYPKAHTAYAETLRRLFETTPEAITDKPVELRLLCVQPKFKTVDRPFSREDVDNLAKLPMDGMTKSGRYWKDDSQIVSLTTMKRFVRDGEEPHTKVRIIPIEGDTADHVDHQFMN